MSHTLLWFRQDFRLDDHPALLHACTTQQPILPVVIVDPHWFSATRLGRPKMGSYRARFWKESIENLAERIQSMGGTLIVKEGDTPSVMADLVDKHDVSEIVSMTYPGTEEAELEEKIEDSVPTTCAIQWIEGHTLLHTEDLPFDIDDLPKVFTPFRKKVEKSFEVREPIAAPSSISWATDASGPTVNEVLESSQLTVHAADAEYDSRAVLPYKGGESAAMERLEQYIWEGDHLKVYKKTRNGLLGANYSSKFSAWLANGCISPRRIWSEVKRYEEQRVSNESTYWLIFELLWRDFFQFSAWKHGAALFYAGGIQGKAVHQEANMERFQRWAEGKTGADFVDANMRELNATGYMSNRGRQNVASFLSQNLGVDWRMGASYFETMLVDYDVASNWGNWAYNSTVGHDPRNRQFDVERQAKMYDSKGTYRKTWLQGTLF
ncbi:MAG: DASH family cryptochrome [Balneolaceae bacterium]|nr:DASH family cryptochrome [Balneolaceae bacterium]